ncbi:PREDICTED: uncharacterized protein LOC109216601 [Nicotiana attenuata]|uniref:uncharacterized protein LOC109216601 n=1 Tax=Nicotiana attenuata TaxID=49451 RepID=UPI000905A557|nr:PREDICTED: uncharacterized protein LOC109216601 [Nicotiana attenuata]
MTQVAQVFEALDNVAMYGSKNTNNTGNYKAKRSQVQCKYCHYKGHTKENCYKLVGYPSDFKSKKKGINTGQYANQVCGAELKCTDRYTVGSNVASSVTQQGRGGIYSNSDCSYVVQRKHRSIRLIKQISCCRYFEQVNAFMSHCVTDKWIVDTGATNHMTSCLDILHNYRALPNIEENKVPLPTGSVDLFSGQVKGIGREEHGLYILHGSTSISASSQATNKCVNTANDVFISSSISSTSSSVSSSNICSLWHKRLGHAPIDIIKKIETLSKLTTVLSSSSYCLVSALSIRVHAQQNGVAERKHRTILEMARSIRFQAAVPLRFWGECVTIVVYLLNRLPFKVIGYNSPFEKLYLHLPSLSHLKVSGCLCYVTAPKVLDKFSPRAVPAVLLGYSSTQKGYILYNLHSKTFMVRNVVFHEIVFPFKHVRDSGTLVFPVLDLLSSEWNAATPISSSAPTVEDSTEPAADYMSSESSADIPTFPTDTTTSELIIPTVRDSQNDACADTSAT